MQIVGGPCHWAFRQRSAGLIVSLFLWTAAANNVFASDKTTPGGSALLSSEFTVGEKQGVLESRQSRYRNELQAIETLRQQQAYTQLIHVLPQLLTRDLRLEQVYVDQRGIYISGQSLGSRPARLFLERIQDGGLLVQPELRVPLVEDSRWVNFDLVGQRMPSP